MQMTNRNAQMNQVNDLFNEFLKPIQDKHLQRKRKQFKPEFARFKLKFWYRDGNESVHYSYDFHYAFDKGVKKTITDEEQGYVKLRNLILKQLREDTYVSAVIWCNLTNDLNTSKDNYRYQVFKHTRGKGSAEVNNLLHFRHGKLDGIDYLIQDQKQAALKKLSR